MPSANKMHRASHDRRPSSGFPPRSGPARRGHSRREGGRSSLIFPPSFACRRTAAGSPHPLGGGRRCDLRGEHNGQRCRSGGRQRFAARQSLTLRCRPGPLRLVETACGPSFRFSNIEGGRDRRRGCPLALNVTKIASPVTKTKICGKAHMRTYISAHPLHTSMLKYIMAHSRVASDAARACAARINGSEPTISRQYSMTE